MRLRVGESIVTTRAVPGGVEVTLGDGTVFVPVARRADGVLLVDGRPADVERGAVYIGGERIEVEVAVERGAAGGPPAGRGLSSPTPATVARVCVAVGEAVEAGQALLLLVAMKTELTLSAPRAGTVRAIHAVPGSAVRAGVPLVELGP